MIHVSTLTLLDELGMERREKRKSTKTQTNMEDVDFTFWNEKITKPPQMYVMYSIGIDFHSQMMMILFNI